MEDGGIELDTLVMAAAVDGACGVDEGGANLFVFVLVLRCFYGIIVERTGIPPSS